MNFKSPWDSPNSSSNNSINFKHQKSILIIIALLGCIFVLSSGVYQVKEGEQSIVVRFGEIVRMGNSGLNFAIPLVEKVSVIPVDKSRRIEIGYRSENKDNEKYHLESTMVTGDENIVRVTADVVFYIDDLEKYAMNVVNPDSTIKSVVESSLREVASRINTQAILSDGKQRIIEQTKQLAQDILDGYGLGIKIEMIQLLTAEPPSQVISAYREVQIAKADKEKFINEAMAYRNKKIPEARGQAQKLLSEAESFKAKRIMQAEGKIARYNVLLDRFISSDKPKQSAIKLEMISEARDYLLSNVKEIIFTDADHVYYADGEKSLNAPTLKTLENN